MGVIPPEVKTESVVYRKVGPVPSGRAGGTTEGTVLELEPRRVLLRPIRPSQVPVTADTLTTLTRQANYYSLWDEEPLPDEARLDQTWRVDWTGVSLQPVARAERCPINGFWRVLLIQI